MSRSARTSDKSRIHCTSRLPIQEGGASCHGIHGDPITDLPSPSLVDNSEGKRLRDEWVSQPTLLTYTQAFSERKENRIGRQLALEERKQEFREQFSERVLEFKREELGVKERILAQREARANRLQEWYTGRRTETLPVQKCTYCMNEGHDPLSCPELARQRRGWPR